VKKALLDFEIDKLTNSIENTISGDSFQTEISLLPTKDLEGISQKKGWLFEWAAELEQNDREVYKLTILHNPSVIQGLISISLKPDHVFLNLLESAPFNKASGKLYAGVPGNLVAFACKLSYQRGMEGFVAFRAKTVLIEHYTKSLNAAHIGRNLMVLDTNAANKLIEKYFK
jgi:hypothetical protein